MNGLKLNLGCGEKRFPGYIYVDKNVDVRLIQQESNIYNNLIEQYDMLLEVIRNSNEEAGGKV